ncbi:MAG: SDR family NAD(P)-dependent oxidoreductase [Comamonas sp.]|nr:SDR family NAD(P)-dependent oxidoreductase [Comamonas sp.]
MIVFITGASAGFGAAMARSFVQAGHHVIASARRKDKLNALAAELGERLLPIELDVNDQAAVAALPTQLPPAFAQVDVLINNAGLALGLEPAQRADIDQWHTMIDTNCKGLVNMTRALLPGMVERKRGHIFNLGSVAGNWPYQGGNVYGATKAFVQQFSRNLRADLLGTPVRVTNVEPGMCGGTEFSDVRFGDAERAAKVYEGVQFLTPEDIASTVLWIAQSPAHMNINAIEIMPVQQSFGGLAIHRGSF